MSTRVQASSGYVYELGVCGFGLKVLVPAVFET